MPGTSRLWGFYVSEDLNTETGAISPDRGNHAIKVTRAGRAGPDIRRRVRCSACCLACSWPGRLAGDICLGAADRSRAAAAADGRAVRDAQQPGCLPHGYGEARRTSYRASASPPVWAAVAIELAVLAGDASAQAADVSLLRKCRGGHA